MIHKTDNTTRGNGVRSGVCHRAYFHRAMMLGALLLTWAFYPPQSSAMIEETLARTLYVESGAAAQTAQTANRFARSVGEGLVNDPAAKRYDINAVIRLVHKTYGPLEMDRIIVPTIGRGLSPEQGKDVLDWLRSETGKKILKCDADAARSPAELVKFAAGLEKQLPPESRLSLAQALDKELRLTKTAAQRAIDMSVAANLAVFDFAANIGERAVEQIRDRMEKERQGIEDALAEQTFVYLLFAYRDLSDKELQKYLDFARSPSGAAWQRTLSSGITEAIAEGTLRLREVLPSAVRSTAPPANKN